MLGNNGFTEKDWPTEGGTTAYADKWTYQTPETSAYNLTISNNGALGIMVSITGSDSQFGPSDYLGPNVSKIYTPTSYVSTAAINGKSNLTVNWSTYSGGPTGNCSQSLNLINNMSVAVAVDNQGKGVCDIEQSQ